MSGSILDNGTKANPSVAYYSGGGGGGGGTVVTTSSIVTSTITANGPILDTLEGPTKPYSFSVGVDGADNAYQIIQANSSFSAYADVRVADGTLAPLDTIRTQAGTGAGQITYLPNPSVAPTTGIRFLSSLNGGPAATAVISLSGQYPLGCMTLPGSNATCPAGAFGLPLCSTFQTYVGHSYEIMTNVQEAVVGLPGVPNPTDRLSYVCDGQVLDTILHSEISTLQGLNPKGRTIKGFFTAVATGPAQLTISNDTGSALSSIVSSANPLSVVVRDLGPNTLILP